MQPPDAPPVATGPVRPCAVAVVGAGLAGLVAAYRLTQQGHRVTLFERHAAAGFVAHSVGVPGPYGGSGGSGGPGAAVRVDVPIRVFYAGYYPTLTRLYAELGVATEAVSYASSFHGEDGALYFRYRNWLVGGRSFSWVAPGDLLGARGARAWRIAAEALRFRRRATRALATGDLGTLSIGEYLAAEGYGHDFVHGLLLPAIATVCTCSYDDARRFPAAVVVDYLARGLTREPVRRAALGADEVARRLLAGAGELRLGCALQSLRREAPGQAVASREAGLSCSPSTRGVLLRLADGRVERFDHVVLATQANQALALLDDASATERAVLGGFAYRPIEVVMHRDERLLPARRGDWSAVNLLVTPAHAQPQSTIWVNRVQPALAGAARPGPGPGLDWAPVFQTVHPIVPPRDEAVISRARFERPVVDAASQRALAALAPLHAEAGRCVWFCGSYAQPGIPLLESAVRSAEVVAGLMAGALAAGQAAPRAWVAPALLPA
ncbi:MAG: NAD(P)-binding protein [Rubrivivax sp.]|nr:NAD(P)-binding protein [Rubrivivax sp.]